MIKRIKTIIRDGIVETNSSSSHTLTIDMRDNLIKRGDPDCNLDIGEDNILYVPQLNSRFEWEFEKFNDCQTKLIYACGLLYPYADGGNNYKPIYAFKNKLKKYLGVDDVVFQWDEDYKKDKKENPVADEYYETETCYPIIDHQSLSDGYLQVFENYSTIIHFIFSRNSWIYGGNDNAEEPERWREETVVYKEEEPNYVIRIIFSEDKSDPLWALDSAITDGYSSLSSSFGLRFGKDDIDIRDTYWDIRTEKIQIGYYKYNRLRTLKSLVVEEENERDYHLNPEVIYQEDSGDLSILYISEEIHKSFFAHNFPYGVSFSSSMKFKEETKIAKEIIKTKKEGIDYKYFPVIIFDDEITRL